METAEHTVRTPDGAELAVEVLGPDGAGQDEAPALLLLGGMGWSRDWWDDELCARLVGSGEHADGGRRVVRHDQRDSGASTTWPVGAPGYDGADLVADAVAVLDALGVARAHVVGLSMGGGVAQHLALAHPDRVAALTLIATSPVSPVGEDLPGPAPALLAAWEADTGETAWHDPAAAVEAIVEGERPFAGPDTFDADHVRTIARRVVARSRDVAATMTNHALMAQAPVPGRLADLAVPAVVLHGDADPLFPAHGAALARAIPGARHVALAGIGHQLPPPSRPAERDLLVDALLRRGPADLSRASVPGRPRPAPRRPVRTARG